jgi:hypothetical protein
MKRVLASRKVEKRGKEVKTMKYEKPEIAVVGSAIEAVQNSNIKAFLPTDSPQGTTVGAYHSDEE